MLRMSGRHVFVASATPPRRSEVGTLSPQLFSATNAKEGTSERLRRANQETTDVQRHGAAIRCLTCHSRRSGGQGIGTEHHRTHLPPTDTAALEIILSRAVLLLRGESELRCSRTLHSRSQLPREPGCDRLPYHPPLPAPTGCTRTAQYPLNCEQYCQLLASRSCDVGQRNAVTRAAGTCLVCRSTRFDDLIRYQALCYLTPLNPAFRSNCAGACLFQHLCIELEQAQRSGYRGPNSSVVTCWLV